MTNTEKSSASDSATTPVTQEVMNTLMWHSRRGMLELDVLLEPFTKNIFPTLSPDEQASYIDLLACQDADLFSWFLGKDKPEDRKLSEIVIKILESNQKSM